MLFNCLIIDDEPHAIEELSDLVAHINNLYVLNTFNNVKSALAFLQEVGHVDIIFSDISMATINGIDAAKLYNNYCDFLIYVTAHREHAIEAFGVNATGYLVKPVSLTALTTQIEGLLKHKQRRGTKEHEYDVFFLKGSQKNSYVKICYNDVTYIEALLNYVIVHTVHGDEISHVGLKAMEHILSEKNHFFRISKSAIISIHHLDRVDGNSIRLKDKTDFTIGEKYRSAFHEFLRKRTLNP